MRGELAINKPNSRFTKVNLQISAPQVRLVDEEGNNLGVVSTRDARDIAYQRELDLIEVVPNANPPVCRLGDFQKYKYEQKLKFKEEKSKNKSVTMKEVRLRYCTGQHDLEIKEKAIRKFIEEKRQVRVVMIFKSRELNFKSQGMELINGVLATVADVAKVDMQPRLNGKNLVAILSPQV